jgi:hypothetical protein
MKIVQQIGLFVAASALTVSPVFAQIAPPAKQDLASPGAVQKIEYVLPYPGILPDHPLFALKELRDKILDFLIVDPVRKAEFYMLQADKRLGMGVMLIDKGNAQMGVQTLSQGEAYGAKVATTLMGVKTSGKEVPAYLLDRLTKSMVKHEEVLTETLGKVTGAELAGLQTSLDVLKKTMGDVASFK